MDVTGDSLRTLYAFTRINRNDRNTFLSVKSFAIEDYSNTMNSQSTQLRRINLAKPALSSDERNGGFRYKGGQTLCSCHQLGLPFWVACSCTALQTSLTAPFCSGSYLPFVSFATCLKSQIFQSTDVRSVQGKHAMVQQRCYGD